MVLDPFIGSRTTAVAAKQLNRNCIGIEIDPTYVQIAQSRLQAVENHTSLVSIVEYLEAQAENEEPPREEHEANGIVTPTIFNQPGAGSPVSIHGTGVSLTCVW